MNPLKKVGIANLPLHHGRAPAWLVTRMRSLASQIVTVIIDEYGTDELLNRLSDSFWFQSLGCCLGYDWHSSGVTTVVTSVLKHAITPEEHGLAVAGGKGRFSRKTPEEIEAIGRVFEWSEGQVRSLQYASRMSAKVDNTALQAGYPLYHHAFFADREGRWVVIQQGMNVEDRTARRYHWLSHHVKSFVNEPHEAVVCDVTKERVLNMTAQESDGCRKASTDIINESPNRVKRLFTSLRHPDQETLERWIDNEDPTRSYGMSVLSLPRHIDWKALKKAYEAKPRDYEELLSIRGIGPATVRGLALVSEIIYGEAPSWRDPVKYSFAYGGKDGVPRPVDRRAMDESIRFLKDAIDRSKIGNKERMRALRRLHPYAPKTR
ncbi:MAG: DUF763 domain-containing protein [Candidatus Bathyarchaeia archaeon]